MVGSFSIKTTKNYAKITRAKIIEDMTNFVDTISGKYELSENDGKIYRQGRRNRWFPEQEIK